VSEQCAAELKGHRLSVVSGSISLTENKLATGGRDSEVILWDIESQKIISQLQIDNNLTTDMVWMPNSNDIFLQTSEDLRLRIFDCREQLSLTSQLKIGDNFATTMDIDNSGNYLVTGHRGFNGNACHVKLWDLRKITEDLIEPVNSFTHDSAVISTRFHNDMKLGDSNLFVISASIDQTLRLTDMMQAHQGRILRTNF
jgi:WD40 repeat protein